MATTKTGDGDDIFPSDDVLNILVQTRETVGSTPGHSDAEGEKGEW